MITMKNPLMQQMLAALTLMMVLAALSMVWPVVLTFFLGVLGLLQPLSAEPEVALLSWAEVGNVPVIVASLRRPGLPKILS